MRRRWAALLCLGLSLPLVIATVAGTLYWPGRIFPGFFVMDTGLVPSIGLGDWTGLAADVPFHARVVAVNGHPVDSNGAIYAAVEAAPAGTSFIYALEKDGVRLERAVTSMRFSPRDYWLTVGLFVANGLLDLAAGFTVILLQPRGADARGFLAFCISSGIFALTGTSLYLPGHPWLGRLHYFSQAIFPAAYIHFALVFPIVRPFLRRDRRWLFVPYAIAGVLTPLIWLDLARPVPTLFPLHATYLFAALSLAVLMVLPAVAWVENAHPLVRPRVYSVLPGIVIGTGLGLYNFVNTARSGGSFPTNYMALTPFVLFAAVAYAIAKHDLFDIDRLLRRTAVYAGLTLAFTAAYAGGLAMAGLVAPADTVRGSPIFAAAFITFVALAIQPLRGALQAAIDRVFARSRVDYRRTVAAAAAALTTVLDLDELLRRVGQVVAEGLEVEGFRFVLWRGAEPREWGWNAANAGLEVLTPPSWPGLRAAMAESQRTVILVGLDDERRDGPGNLLGATLEERGVALIVPLRLGDTVRGVFLLGRKRSGAAFRAEELDVLATLADQTAIAVENAQSYRELESLNAELEARVRDRTVALQTAYDELKSAQTHLLQSEKMASLGQLVAGVAHEINNPVSFIVGNLDALREALEQLRQLATAQGDLAVLRVVDRVGRIFEVMGRGAERTAAIVNDLRTFSRPGEAALREMDVHESLEMSLRLLRPRWADRIDIVRAYGDIPCVEAIPGQMNQVFMNLLANAFDAIADRGTVSIRTGGTAASVDIAISDDGSGIAADHLSRIFDPFFTTKPQGKGTGLGLAISHGIVTHHGGSLRVDSPPGRGATFTVSLPVRRAGAEEIEARDLTGRG